FQGPSRLATGDKPIAQTSADFNGDGKRDLAVANAGSEDVTLLRGQGDGNFESAYSIPLGARPSCLLAGDLNGDGRSDLVVGDGSSGGVVVLLGRGGGTFGPPLRTSVGVFPKA